MVGRGMQSRLLLGTESVVRHPLTIANEVNKIIAMMRGMEFYRLISCALAVPAARFPTSALPGRRHLFRTGR